ncbi:MAG: hypothetical protein JL50_12370 [Peptococcaceae bacterium BICA1-7]|nr:MAG: hypothetical protein JL50_12370 [Peptococcaceae bacterium BICA1-7]HBV97025.1 hypothetical protein [Desulfotomaculum sp.]
MAKPIKEGLSYSQRDIMELLIDFSSFKDRVEKKFRDVARELEGKPNEHELWVNLYMISTDYSEEVQNKKAKVESSVQKVS